MADQRYLATLEQKKRASTAQLLFRCSRLLNDRALARVRAETGVAEVRAAHTAVLPHLDFEGIRLTDLAERLGVSKQAAFQLIEELEGFGMVEKRSDPEDGRAKLVRFSRKGERALLDGLKVLGDLERELSKEIGKSRFAALNDALSALLPVLEATDPRPSKEVTAPTTRPRRARSKR